MLGSVTPLGSGINQVVQRNKHERLCWKKFLDVSTSTIHRTCHPENNGEQPSLTRTPPPPSPRYTQTPQSPLSSYNMLENVAPYTFACPLLVRCPLWFAQDGPEQEMIDGAGEEEEINACEQWVLPSAVLEGVRDQVLVERARDRDRRCGRSLSFREKSAACRGRWM